MRNKYILILFSLWLTIVSYGQVIVSTPDAVVDGLGASPSREKPIGKTKSKLDVSLTGAAVYSIPIQIPKGVNGVEPQISLTYNSQSGMGIAGLGWSISGVSSISRIPSTLYHDGVVNAINFSTTDRFALDGQRLLLKSGTYGGDGAEYQTENFSNIKITSHGISPYGTNYGPKYFKVEYPDGSIALYGNTDNSRSRIEFGISSFKNTSNVDLKYSYVEKGNRLLISTISYVSRIKDLIVGPGTGGEILVPTDFEKSKKDGTDRSEIEVVQNQQLDSNVLVSAYVNEVKFIYADDDMIKETSYIGGIKFEHKDYLTKIETLSHGSIYRTYFIDYNKDRLGYKLLSRVSEYNGVDTMELIPIKVEYNQIPIDESSLVFTKTQPTNLEGDVTANYYGAINGDFDGDGVLDYMIYSKFKREYWIYHSTAEREGQFVHKNSGIGVVDAIFPLQLKNTNNEILPYEGWVEISKGNINIRSLSNGVIKEEYNKKYTFPKFQIAPSPSNCNSGIDQELQNDYFSGDFDGDNLTDIIAIQKPTTVFLMQCSTKPPLQVLPREQIDIKGGKVYLLNPYDSSTTPSYIGFISDYTHSSKVYTGSFLGTNKTDLLVVNDNKMVLYTYNGTDFIKVYDYLTTNEWFKDRQVHLGDFNGDGKTDIMFTNYSRTRTVFYGTGNGFEVVTEDRDGNFYNTSIPNKVVKGVPGALYTSYIATDFNNDGKTDFIAFQYIVRPEDYRVEPYATYVYKKGGTLYSISFIKNDGDHRYSYDKTIELNVVNEDFDLIQSQDYNVQFVPIPIYLKPFSKFAYTTDNFRMGLFINQKMYTFEYRYNHAKDKLMKSVNEGNSKFSIKYGQYGVKPSRPTDKTDFDYYMKYSNTKEQYPLLELNTIPNIYVVAEIKLNNNSETELKQSFSYASPVVNLKGLGFLGFKGVVSTNWYDKPENMFKNIKEFDIQNRGFLKKESVAAGNQWDSFIPKVISSPSGPIARFTSFESVVDYEYQTELLDSKVFKPRLTKVIENNYGGFSVLLGRDSFVKETVNTYNQYNDVVKQQVQYKQMHGLVMVGQPGFTLNKTEITENTYAYGAANPNYFMSRLLKSKLTQTIPGESSFATEDSYTYDDKGRVVEAIKKGNNIAETIIEKNTYDQYGNVVEKRMKAGNLPERKETYEYGWNGRFLIQKTDVDGLKTSYLYNGSKGFVTHETNIFGQRTQFLYNNWQQVKSVIDHLGKVTNIKYLKTQEGFEITKQNEEGAWSQEKYDLNGNNVKVSFKNITGEIVHQSFEYDGYNRLVKESENYFGNTPSLWNVTTYDNKGRVSKVKTSNGKEITTTYTINTAKVNDGVSTKETKINAAGYVISKKDEGGEIKYTYFSNGNLKSVNYDGVVISLEQDGWGRKTKLMDPSAGTYTYAYNAFGELIKETSPKGTTQFTFDNFGKLTKKQITGDYTNTEIKYNYAGDTKQLQSSVSIVNGESYNYNYVYDHYHRLSKTTEVTPVATFTKELTFDDFGREAEEVLKVQAHGKTTERRIKNQYQNGHHWQVLDALTNKVLVTKESTNEYDALTKVKLGNGLEVINTYDVYGNLKSNTVKKETVGIFTLSNQFDPQRGNLLSRTNGLFNRTETFTYDNLDRLTSFTNKAGVQETQVYDNKGRITSNNIGDYSYPNISSYQLESIDLDTSAQSYYQLRPEQQIAYNTFKNPVWIKEVGKENVYFDYNPNNQRSIMYYGDLAESKEQSPLRRYYSADGNIEVNYNKTTNKVDFVFYLDGDAYSATVIAKGENTPEYYYLHRDYLGSILAITNGVGNIVEKRHFDAWGNLVFVKDGQNNDLGQLTFLDRGFTGHEHLQGVALVHMNGRLYDPTVRRFLAPDNFIQDISNTQNFNRYGYVWNNPLVYTDQNGEVVHIIIGAAIGGLVNWGMNGFKFDASGLQAFGVGAIAGAIGTATGGAAFAAMGGAAGGVGGFLAGAGAGIVGSVTQTAVLTVGNAMFLGGPALTTKDLLFAAAIGGVTGGLVNGGIAASNGRSFWSGANPVAKPLPATLTPVGITPKQPDTGLSSSATMKSVPDLAYTNEIKNSVTKVVPLPAVDRGIQGGPLRIPNTTGSTVLEEITINATSKTGSQFLLFGGDEAIIHFGKHGKSIMDMLGKNSYNLNEYVRDANFIIKNGTFVPELNGYVRLIGGKGSAKFGFVGLNRTTGSITTFHIKTAQELAKKAPSMFGY